MTTTTNREARTPDAAKLFTPATILGISLVSLIYFADIFIRASHKLFWADELFTYYLCRLPKFSQTWTAITHGVDFNPPLFYLLTRWSRSLFGEGLIGLRMPEIIGAWLFGVCLFVFVARRAGRIAGAIAGIAPFFTLAHYYSYEARPHAITLGWCGLSLLCWQMAGESRRRWPWLLAFGLCVEGAVLTHVYAVFLVLPFVGVMLIESLRTRKIDWGLLLAVILPFVVAAPIYLVLVRSFRSMKVAGGLTVGPQDFLQAHLSNVYGPGVAVLLLSVAAFALRWNLEQAHPPESNFLPSREFVLAAFFAAIPLVAMVGVVVSNGPIFDRYLLPATAGYAIFLGFANAQRRVASWIPATLAGCIILLMLGDLGMAFRHARPGGNFGLREPVSKFAFATHPERPMELHPLLTAANVGDEDVLVLEQLDYIYFFRYAPPAVVPHLYFAAPSADEIFIGAYQRLGKWARLDMKTTLYAPFFKTHDKFLVYSTETLPPGCHDCIEDFMDAGYRLKSVRRAGDDALFEYERP